MSLTLQYDMSMTQIKYTILKVMHLTLPHLPFRIIVKPYRGVISLQNAQ
jgi:hypothetical protein